MRDVIVHKHTQFFVEYVRADLKRENTTNVVDIMKDVIKRLEDLISIKYVFAFVSDSFNGMRDVSKVLMN